ncbi:MAG: acyltransferase [Eubacteriales bacterium]|nr:acyltransferase [Eubacteriales bacterium]
MKQIRFEQLDGVRAFAILLVVASHTSAFGMTGQGGLGVAIFFALSGFLFVIPGIPDGEERFCSVSSILFFYMKRALRLLPSYYIILLSVYWITDFSQGLAGNLLFTNCQGHLWFLQQEVFFYLLAPFLMLILFFLKKICKFKNLHLFFLLLAIAYLSQKYLTVDVFYLMGNGKEQNFRLGLFLIGMAFGYLYKSEKCSSIKTWLGKASADFICLFLVCCSIFSSAFFLSRFNPELSSYYVGWNKPLLCAFGTGIFLFLILANKDGILSRLFRLPLLVSIGKSSYGIYLIHYFLIPYINFSTPVKNFTAVFFVSLGIGMILYVWIEQPIQRLLKKKR